jgi:hypothetical protein
MAAPPHRRGREPGRWEVTTTARNLRDAYEVIRVLTEIDEKKRTILLVEDKAHAARGAR